MGRLICLGICIIAVDQMISYIQYLAIVSFCRRRENVITWILPSIKKQKKIRSVKKYKTMVRDRDGLLRELLPTDTLWYLFYISNPPNTERLLKLFRRRFRLPYDTFITLSNDISTNPIFDRWNRCDAVGVKPSNRKLLLLGVLRYIGRAWTLDDIAEANGISLL